MGVTSTNLALQACQSVISILKEGRKIKANLNNMAIKRIDIFLLFLFKMPTFLEYRDMSSKKVV